MNDEIIHTDSDGDMVYVTPVSHGAAIDRGQFLILGAERADGSEAVGTYLDRSGASAVITRLTRYVADLDEAARLQAREDRTTANSLALGTRVRISDNPMKTREGTPARYAEVFAGKVGVVDYRNTFGMSFGRVGVRVDGIVTGEGHNTTDIHVSSLTVEPLPAPDYAAQAASFKPGDLALVSDNPGICADGTGYVRPEFAGMAVNVVRRGVSSSECLIVALSNGDQNTIHVAHITKAKAVPA